MQEKGQLFPARGGAAIPDPLAGDRHRILRNLAPQDDGKVLKKEFVRLPLPVDEPLAQGRQRGILAPAVQLETGGDGVRQLLGPFHKKALP